MQKGQKRPRRVRSKFWCNAERGKISFSRGDHGASIMWMSVLFGTAMVMAWRCSNQYFKMRVADVVSRVELGQNNIIYNIPHVSIPTPFYTWQTYQKRFPASNAKNQERYHLHPSSDGPTTTSSTSRLRQRWLNSYLKSIGLIKYAKVIETTARNQSPLIFLTKRKSSIPPLS